MNIQNIVKVLVILLVPGLFLGGILVSPGYADEGSFCKSRECAEETKEALRTFEVVMEEKNLLLEQIPQMARDAKEKLLILMEEMQEEIQEAEGERQARFLKRFTGFVTSTASIGTVKSTTEFQWVGAGDVFTMVNFRDFVSTKDEEKEYNISVRKYRRAVKELRRVEGKERLISKNIHTIATPCFKCDTKPSSRFDKQFDGIGFDRDGRNNFKRIRQVNKEKYEKILYQGAQCNSCVLVQLLGDKIAFRNFNQRIINQITTVQMNDINTILSIQADLVKKVYRRADPNEPKGKTAARVLNGAKMILSIHPAFGATISGAELLIPELVGWFLGVNKAIKESIKTHKEIISGIEDRIHERRIDMVYWRSSLKDINRDIRNLLSGAKRCISCTVTISGKVNSDDDKALSGAMVMVKIEDQEYIVFSGDDGSYDIRIPESVQLPETVIVMVEKKLFNNSERTVYQKDFDKVDFTLSILPTAKIEQILVKDGKGVYFDKKQGISKTIPFGEMKYEITFAKPMDIDNIRTEMLIGGQQINGGWKSETVWHGSYNNPEAGSSGESSSGKHLEGKQVLQIDARSKNGAGVDPGSNPVSFKPQKDGSNAYMKLGYRSPNQEHSLSFGKEEDKDSSTSTEKTGEGCSTKIVTRGSVKIISPGCCPAKKGGGTSIPIDLGGISKGEINIKLTIGKGESAGSFNILQTIGGSPKVVSQAYDIRQGRTVYLKHSFSEKGEFSFGSQGNWFSRTDSTNTVNYEITVKGCPEEKNDCSDLNGKWNLGTFELNISQVGTKINGVMTVAPPNPIGFKKGDELLSGKITDQQVNGTIEVRTRLKEGKKQKTHRANISLKLSDGGNTLSGQHERYKYNNNEGRWIKKNSMQSVALTRVDKCGDESISDKEKLSNDAVNKDQPLPAPAPADSTLSEDERSGFDGLDDTADEDSTSAEETNLSDLENQTYELIAPRTSLEASVYKGAAAAEVQVKNWYCQINRMSLENLRNELEYNSLKYPRSMATAIIRFDKQLKADDISFYHKLGLIDHWDQYKSGTFSINAPPGGEYRYCLSDKELISLRKELVRWAQYISTTYGELESNNLKDKDTKDRSVTSDGEHVLQKVTGRGKNIPAHTITAAGLKLFKTGDMYAIWEHEGYASLNKPVSSSETDLVSLPSDGECTFIETFTKNEFEGSANLTNGVKSSTSKTHTFTKLYHLPKGWTCKRIAGGGKLMAPNPGGRAYNMIGMGPSIDRAILDALAGASRYVGEHIASNDQTYDRQGAYSGTYSKSITTGASSLLIRKYHLIPGSIKEGPMKTVIRDLPAGYFQVEVMVHVGQLLVDDKVEGSKLNIPATHKINVTFIEKEAPSSEESEATQ